MGSGDAGQRDLVTLVVDSLGAVVETDVIWEPYRLVDPGGGVVASVTQFLQGLQAGGRSPSTQRSYAHLCRSRNNWYLQAVPELLQAASDYMARAAASRRHGAPS